MGMFDFVDYDAETLKQQKQFKEAFLDLEKGVNLLPPGRARSLVLTHIEEAYMWIGKALRDAQQNRESKT